MILSIAVQGYEINPYVLAIGLFVLAICGIFGGRFLRFLANKFKST